MKAFEKIQDNLKQSNLEDISNKLGYSNEKKGLNALHEILVAKNLHSWLHSGFYDFKFNAKELYKNLADLYNISKEEVEEELKQAELYQEEYDSLKESYIFVNTNFVKTTQPVFVLAFLEGLRRIRPKREELMFKSTEEVLEKIGNIIREHYHLKGGKLEVWGEIKNYQYHHKDGKVYLFDVEGNYIPNLQIPESKAILKM